MMAQSKGGVVERKVCITEPISILITHIKTTGILYKKQRAYYEKKKKHHHGRFLPFPHCLSSHLAVFSNRISVTL